MEGEFAQSSPLPKRQFAVIEFPGFFDTHEKAVAALGGAKAIDKALNAEPGSLELRFGESPFSHPIFGDFKETGNVILKVTTRKRKVRSASDNASDKGKRRDPGEVIRKAEIVGCAVKTCRFRALADFQVVVPPTDPLTVLKKALDSFDVESLLNFKFEDDKGPVPYIRNMPPPIFTQTQWSLDYGYLQNPAIKKVLVQQKENEAPVVQLVNSSRSQKFVVVSVDPNGKEKIPTEPPPEIASQIDKVSPAILDRYRELFESRPVWLRLPLLNTLKTKEEMDSFKLVVPLVAYVMQKGPWRETWVRYGYNPTKDKNARFFQLFDMRNVKTAARTPRASRMRGYASVDVPKPIEGGASSLGEAIARSQETKSSDSSTSHIFDGVSYNDSVGFYQLIDVTDPDLTKMINTKKNIRKICDEKDGWFERSHFENMREVLKKKIHKLSGRSLDDEYETLQLDEGSSEEDIPEDIDANEEQEDHDADKDNEEGAQQMELSSEAHQEGAVEPLIVEPENTHLNARVEELMRNLQNAQESSGGQSNEFTVDELDYYEVWGDEDEDDET
ncbi:RNA polymerase III transcription factor IIIC subunit-domain-containing protein [Cladochytrium replicatum]|nr:RNA polymerase III transcription factor IIIC subunit-domain-containing protein [Cladochytrium replicatum]